MGETRDPIGKYTVLKSNSIKELELNDLLVDLRIQIYTIHTFVDSI